jgi:hypothetical protein
MSGSADQRSTENDVVFSGGKYQGVAVRTVPTWYLRFVARSWYLFETPQKMAALEELRARERGEGRNE